MGGRKWHKGPPPHVGWWNASASNNEDIWRWWDGKRWSQGVFDTVSCEVAASYASQPTAIQGIKWTDYYPKNARVPRLNPWIRWDGGDCPVPFKTHVDVLFRCGKEMYGETAAGWYWKHDDEYNHNYDIVAYRLHGDEVAP